MNNEIMELVNWIRQVATLNDTALEEELKLINKSSINAFRRAIRHSEIKYIEIANKYMIIKNKKQNVKNLLMKVIKKESEQEDKKNCWNNTFFEEVNKLKCDTSGKVGEKFISEFCDLQKILNEYKEDKNSNDGTYDIKINNKKIEIKTARQGGNKSFQHESLRNDGCDFYLFIDIKPNEFYITILPKFDLKKKSEIIGRKPHLRKGTNDVFKFDFSEMNIIFAIKNGYSIKVSDNTTKKNLKDFINNLIK